MSAPRKPRGKRLEAKPAKCCGTCKLFAMVRVRELADGYEYTEIRCAAKTGNPKLYFVCKKYEGPCA